MEITKIIEKKDYPPFLKKINDPPSQLFWRGNYQKNIFNNTLSVIGSRRMTSYGKRVTEEIVSTIAAQGITVISGFMYGIDATAHKAALSVGGKTIAVMPCGTDIIHPAHQKDLYWEIMKKGLIVSEYEDGFPPDKWTYVKRNRIVAGLSKATLIIESAEKSGSLITANLALKYKRKLFAIPGSIFSPVSKGTNELIKKKLAEPVLGVKDILDFFKKEGGTEKEYESKELIEKERKIVCFLKNEPAELDAILAKTKMSISEISVTLSILEIRGIIKREGLKYYLN